MAGKLKLKLKLQPCITAPQSQLSQSVDISKLLNELMTTVFVELNSKEAKTNIVNYVSFT